MSPGVGWGGVGVGGGCVRVIGGREGRGEGDPGTGGR